MLEAVSLDWGAVLARAGRWKAGLQVAVAGGERVAATGRLAPFLQEHPSLRHWEPAVAVENVSGTTGAGDVATGGFLAGLMTGQGPVAAAGLAAAEAARHVAGASTVHHHTSNDQETPS